jgi:hypothetical protein
MSVRRLIVVFAALFLLTVFFGVEDVRAEEGRHTVGVQAGQVGLSGDVANFYGNALGWGLFFDYAASDWLEFEVSYLNSRHTKNSAGYSQGVFGAGVLYNIDQFDIFVPYLRGGAEFISVTGDLPSPVTLASYSTTGFGLAVGVGGKFLLGENFMTGLDLTYHSAFDASVTPTGGSSTKILQSFTTIMLRLGFVFDGGGSGNPNKTF